MPINVELTLPRLHPAQQHIKRNAKRFNVVCCGRRFGKTKLGVDLLIEPALLRGRPVAWFAPNYKYLLEAWWSALDILGPAIKRKSDSDHNITLHNGALIEFWALDRDPECSRSRRYARVIIDEAAKVRYLEQAWLKAIRANLGDYCGDAFFMSTPRGRNYFWQLSEKPKTEPEEWAFFRSPTNSNPFMKPREIEAMRKDMGPVIASQEIEAEFLEVGGRFFWNWDEDKHTIVSRPVPRFWHFFGGIDYGTTMQSKTFAFVLNAMDTEGRVFTIAELLLGGALPRDQAAKVKEVIDRFRPDTPPLLACDRAGMFPPEKHSERLGEYPVEAFWDLGLNCVAAVKHRGAGWTRCKEWLNGEIEEEKAWQFFKGGCPELCRAIPLAITAENDTEDIDDTGDQKAQTHILDAWRYSAMTRPYVPDAPPERPVHGVTIIDGKRYEPNQDLPFALQSERDLQGGYINDYDGQYEDY